MSIFSLILVWIISFVIITSFFACWFFNYDRANQLNLPDYSLKGSIIDAFSDAAPIGFLITFFIIIITIFLFL